MFFCRHPWNPPDGQAFAAGAQPLSKAMVQAGIGSLLAVIASGVAAQAFVSNPAPPAYPSGTTPLALKRQADLIPGLRIDSITPAPTFASGLRIDKRDNRFMTIEGSAEVRKRNQVLKADQIDYDETEDYLQARGNVKLFRDNDWIAGPTLDMKVDAQTGTMPNPEYYFAEKKAQGEAERMDFLGPSRYQLDNATYSTCEKCKRDWYIKARDLRLDYGEQEAVAREATLYFFDVPIFYTPWATFPLGVKRRTGFLPPTVTQSTTLGAEIGLPFYWFIAPQHDATITTRVSTLRGMQLAGEYRYLNEKYSGLATAEAVPYDAVAAKPRGGLRWIHSQTIMSGLTATAELNHITDRSYLLDYPNRLEIPGTTVLPRNVALTYSSTFLNSGAYTVTARTSNQKIVQDPLNPITPPYERQPELTLTASRLDWHGFDFTHTSELVRFAHPTLVNVSRMVNFPAISYPLVSPGAFLIPKLQVHSSHYSFSKIALNQPGTLSRTVPIFSIDTGLVFERDTQTKHALETRYIQTLEPRAFYSYVPKRDQTLFPNFDSGAPDFNIAQLFTENRYVGSDRFANVNQLTLAATSRFLDSSTGKERLRMMAAQRFFFTPQDPITALPGETLNPIRRSDSLFAVTAGITPTLTLDTSLQYNPRTRLLDRASAGISWRPGEHKVISAAYRYNRNLVVDSKTLAVLDQIDLSMQWPVTNLLGGTLYTVGRVNYSKSERRTVDVLAGFEFQRDCWVFRTAWQKYVTATQRSANQIFFQIEFNDLGAAGLNPLKALGDNIVGYRRLNDPSRKPLAPVYLYPQD